MRYLLANAFIAHECREKRIDPADIATNITETYAQCNEDIIVESLLRAILFRQNRQMSSIRYIEIGANHPIQTSSTYLLYRVHGACGVLVEPIPALAERLRATRPRDSVVNCAVGVSRDPFVTLNVHEKSELSSVSADHIARFASFGGRERILETISCPNMHINDFMKAHGGGRIDYLSVDAEGLDLDLIAHLDDDYRPTLIQCEHENRTPEFCRVLADRGYGLVAATDVNILFARDGIF